MMCSSSGPLDVRGAARAGDQRGVRGGRGVHAFAQKLGNGRKIGINVGLAQQDDVDFRDHAGQTNVLVIRVHHAGAAAGHAELGAGQAHVDAGQMVAQAVAQAGKALFLAGQGQGGEILVVKVRRGHNALHTGGHLVGAQRALLHAGLVGQQFGRGFVFTDIHHILQGRRHGRHFLHHGVDYGGFGAEGLYQFRVHRGHSVLL